MRTQAGLCQQVVYGITPSPVTLPFTARARGGMQIHRWPTLVSCHCLAPVTSIKTVLRAQVRRRLTLQQEVPLSSQLPPCTCDTHAQHEAWHVPG